MLEGKQKLILNPVFPNDQIPAHTSFHIGVEQISHCRAPEAHTQIYIKPDYDVKNIVTHVKKSSIIINGRAKKQMDL